MKKLFTLIELIVVIVVLGILAAIVIPNISNFKEEAFDTAVISNATNIQTGLDLYSLENNGQLPSIDAVTEIKPSPIDFGKLKPEHLRNLPKTKDIKYWVDFKGKVWFGTLDSPIISLKDLGNEKVEISWSDNGSINYKVYQLNNYNKKEGMITSKAKQTNLELVQEGLELSFIGDNNTAYVVSSTDINNYESAPSGNGYTPYPEVKDNIVINKITPEIPLPIGPTPLQKTVPNGWTPIYTVEDLNLIRSNQEGKFILMNNLDFNGTAYSSGKGWNPIPLFKGDLDGNGLEIKGLYINLPTTNEVGFFKRISNATIKNLRLVDVNVIGANSTGGLVGYHQVEGHSYIEKVLVTGKVTGPNRAGGLVGFSTGNSAYSLFVISSHVNATIYGNGNTGGLIGQTTRSQIKDSYFIGDMKGTVSVGGLVGDTSYSIIINSYSVATFNNKAFDIGGVLGTDYGFNAPGEQNVFFDSDKAGFSTDASSRILPRKTINMMTKSNYTGWDFNTVWTIDEGKRYPTLKWLEK